MQDISIIGIGRLGLPLAVVFASRDFRVIGVDVDEAAIEAVNARQVPPRIYEPGLQELLDGLEEENLIATDDLAGAVQHTDASIVLVPTPSDNTGAFSLDYVLEVCRGIGKALKDKTAYHLVVIASTVMPGSCDGPIRETIEETSGKKLGNGWGLCYCPEFIALGNAVKGFLNPDFVLIGSSDARAALELSNIYHQLCANDAPHAHMSLVNAEITKVALNCSITVKITLANQLAELCEAFPGGDVDAVTGAIGLDSRIGPKYFRGGPKFGGPCFPRDTRALSTAARSVGVNAPLIEEVDRINAWQSLRLSRLALAQIGNRQNVTFGILGLAYKTDTNIDEESPGVGLIKALEPYGHNIIAYDPLVVIGNSLRLAQEVADYADIVIVTMNWPGFREVEFRKGQVVIDCWRMLNEDKVTETGAKYIAIGRGP